MSEKQNKTKQTSITIARSTTRLVTEPRTRLMTLLATDDEPISTSICMRKAYELTNINWDKLKIADKRANRRNISK